MSIFSMIQRWAARQFGQLTWYNLLLLLFSYSLISWFLLYWAGEDALIESVGQFFYYLIVTASTVGYGDYSPQSEFGKWAATLFIIPGGLSLFAMALGRIAKFLVESWRKGLLGQRKLNVKNHILILGWNEQRTLQMIRMLLHEEDGHRRIALCAKDDIENPMPGKIDFIKVSSYTCEHDMDRAGVRDASCFVVDTLEDDITLTASLFLSCHNPNADLITYFNDQSLTRLLKLHCPNAESIPSVAVELLAKSASDPGSSQLHKELITSHHGMTQYSVIYPKSYPKIIVSELFFHMKKDHDAILIAVDNGDGVILNPDLALSIQPGCKLFYIADERVAQFKWPLAT